MNFYSFSKFCLASSLVFPELLPFSQKSSTQTPSLETADITISVGTVDTHTSPNFENSQMIVGNIPEVADFCFKEGREIIVQPYADVDEAMLRTVILGPAMCLLLKQRGLLVLHASCVNINGQAVAFMGGAGWGKSTMVTTFHSRGYDVLTDDVMPIEISHHQGKLQATVLPSYPQFKVSSEALTSLGEETAHLRPVYANSTKLSYQFSAGFQKEPLPLQKIYVLRKGDKHEISPIAAQNAFGELVRHTRTINVIQAHKSLVTDHFKLCTQLIKLADFSYFTRKPALADLPYLVQLIESDIQRLSTALQPL